MKFTCNSKVLSYAVHKCMSLTQHSRTFPYLNDVRLEAYSDFLKVSATDNYTFATMYVSVDIDEPGVAIVDAKSLAAFLYVKSGELDVHTTDHNLIAKLSGNRVLLKLYKGNYPEFPRMSGKAAAKILGGQMLNLLKVASMAEEDTSIDPKYSGTFLMFSNGKVHSMATNKFRLGCSWVDVEYEGESQFLVPPQTIRILDAFTDPKEPIKIYNIAEERKNRLFFVSDRFIISTSELAGTYPYEAIMKMTSVDRQHHFSVETMEIIDTLKACRAITGNAKSIQARTITIESDSYNRIATIKTSEANEIGVMDLQVKISDIVGNDFVFSINSDFIDRAIGVIEKARNLSEFVEDKIILSLSEETSFVYISAKGVDSVFTIAPINKPTIKTMEEELVPA